MSLYSVLWVNQERTGYFSTKSPLGDEHHHQGNADAVRCRGEGAVAGG